jgi:hypothetical protein
MEREQVKHAQKNSRKAAKTLSDSSTEDLAWGYDDQLGIDLRVCVSWDDAGFYQKGVIHRYPALSTVTGK